MNQAKASYVFDHADTKLGKFAKLSGCIEIKTTKQGDARDEEVGDFLLNETDWNIAFLHINPVPWLKLVEELKGDFVIVRFSREGHPPTPPQGANSLCLHCIKKISEITQEDITSLLAALSDDDVRKSLRVGIPSSIQHLIPFREPHRLRSLEILLGGLLAAWSRGSDNAKTQEKANTALKLEAVPPAPPDGFTLRKSLWRHLGISSHPDEFDVSVERLKEDLGNELGVEQFATDPNLGGALRDLCETLFQPETKKEIDVDTAILCFVKLRDYLEGR